MKTTYLLLLTIFLSALTMSEANSQEGINFFHGKWEEALAVAKKENKMIFLDAYAAWCGPCKRLSRDVFPKKEAGDFFNSRFISFKQDMEKGEGLAMRKKYRVTAFPTLFFIDPDGNIVQATKGAPRTPKDLIATAAKALEKFDGADKYAQMYEEGKRDYHTMFNYVKALNKNRESSVMVANEYIASQQDMGTAENLLFLYEATTRLDSRIFDLFEQHKEAIISQKGKAKVEAKLKDAAWNTVYTGIQFETYELVTDAKTNYGRHVSKKAAEEFACQADLMYYQKHKQEASYLSVAKEYLASESGDSNTKRFEISSSIVKAFGESEEAMIFAEKIAAKAAKENPVEEFQLHYATILVQNNKKGKAGKYLEKCIDHAINEGTTYRQMQTYLDDLQNG